MKKSLVALAALAAVGAASAQSSVTMYGRIDIGYGNQTTVTRDGSGRIRTSGVMDGGLTSNAIGFRGTEDLGGGLKANFVFEQGLNPTGPALFAQRAAGAGQQVDGFSGAGSAGALSGTAGAYAGSTNRQSYVGVSSDSVGTFNIGRQYTALYELATLSGYNTGSEGTIGAEKAHLHGQFGVGGARANMIQYISPNFAGGFVARVQYGAGDGRETVEATTAGANGLTTDKQRRMALMLQYANGPLSVGAAYTNLRSQSVNGVAGAAAGATTNIFGVITPAGATVLTGQNRSANLFQLGGSYDFGVAKVSGTYNRGKNGGAATVTAAQFAAGQTSGFNSTYRSYQIGVAVPFGAIVPFISYGRATTDSSDPAGTGATATAAATNRTEDYRQYQVGVRYSISKRTTAYAFYGQVRNSAAALAGNSSFYNDKKTIVGVAHSF